MATRAYWPMSISKRPSASENTDLIFPHWRLLPSTQCVMPCARDSLLSSTKSVRWKFAQPCSAQIPRSGDHDCAPVALQEQQRSQARAMNVVQQIFIPVRLDQFGDHDRDKAIGVFLFPLAHEFQDRLVNLPVG